MAQPLGVAAQGIGKVRSISAGWTWTYAVLANGKIAIWLANGTGDGSAPFVDRSLSRARIIATGESQTCAVWRNNTVKCWGYNGSGELGRPPLRKYYPKVLITRP